MSNYRDETVTMPDGGEMNLAVWTPDSGSGPGILLIQEIFGVGDRLRTVGARLADAGYVVAAPEVFWRFAPGWSVEPDEAGMQEAIGKIGQLDFPQAIADCGVALDATAALPEATGTPGVLGFCLGGSLAFAVAADFEPTVAVSYYGSQVPAMLSKLDRITVPITVPLRQPRRVHPRRGRRGLGRGHRRTRAHRREHRDRRTRLRQRSAPVLQRERGQVGVVQDTRLPRRAPPRRSLQLDLTRRMQQDPMAVASAAGVARLAGRLPGGMTLERGEQIHDFVRAQRPSSCLELGTANGVGALYIGSALEANGHGTLTSVDQRRSAQSRRPQARDLVQEAGLSGRVTLVHEETSYTWFLHDTLRSQLTADGEVEPKYDFVYIDGAHSWDVDGLAFALVDRLLVPGGWILFDDLTWVFDAAMAERSRLSAVTRPGPGGLGVARAHASWIRRVPQRRALGLGPQVG